MYIGFWGLVLSVGKSRETTNQDVAVKSSIVVHCWKNDVLKASLLSLLQLPASKEA